MNQNKILIIIVAIVIGIFIARFALQQAGILETSEQVRMREYLEGKYQQEFIVTQPIRKAHGLGVEGYFEATAHPKNDESLVFQVRTSSRSENDEYAGTVWQQEELERILPIIKQAFGEGINFKLEIKTTNTFRGNLDIRGAVPPFSTGLNKYGDKIRYTLSIEGKHIPTEEEKWNIAKNIIQLRTNLPIEATDVIVNYHIKISNTQIYGLSVSGDILNKSLSPETIIEKFREWRTAQ